MRSINLENFLYISGKNGVYRNDVLGYSLRLQNVSQIILSLRFY